MARVTGRSTVVDDRTQKKSADPSRGAKLVVCEQRYFRGINVS